MKYYYHKLLIKYNNTINVIILIKNDEQLEKYINNIHEESILGIDTEFRRIDSYTPELCLIQIATSSQLECIDILSINNLDPLFNKLYDGKTLWVIHSARQDIEALYYLSERTPSLLFDFDDFKLLRNIALPLHCVHHNFVSTFRTGISNSQEITLLTAIGKIAIDEKCQSHEASTLTLVCAMSCSNACNTCAGA